MTAQKQEKEDVTMTDADERRVRKALQGLEFPADKDAVMTYAEERGAEPKTVRALEALPEGRYDNTDAVEQALPQRPEQATAE